MKPGLYPCQDSAYREAEGVNISLLVHGLNSMAHLKYQLDNPQPSTDAMRFGTAVHYATYEPDSLAKHVVKGLDIDRRSNTNKETWSAFEKEHEKKIILSSDDWERMIEIRDSIWRNPTAKEILQSPGQNEVAVFWNDKETGLPCKGRLDRFCKWQGQSLVTDLKTTISAAYDDFRRQVVNLNYHVKAAWYLAGLNAIAEASRRWMFIAVEKEPPFCTAIYEPDDDALREGKKRFRQLLRQYAECLSKNEWPAYPLEPQPLSLPKWAFSREDWI